MIPQPCESKGLNSQHVFYNWKTQLLVDYIKHTNTSVLVIIISLYTLVYHFGINQPKTYVLKIKLIKINCIFCVFWTISWYLLTP